MSAAVIPGCVALNLGSGSGLGAPANSIRVVFENLTTKALDVEFYHTANQVTDVDAELFIEANRLTDVGFAGTGLLEPLTTETVDISCDQARTIGTNGGLFRDADDGSELGRGTRRVLVLNESIQCGETLRLRYTETAGGFETSFTLK
jgi:hypothetical protein